MIIMDTKVIIRKQDRISYILSGLCEFWGVPKEYITKPAHRSNPTQRDRKYIAMYILYNIADCTLKDCSMALGYNRPGDSHWYALRDITERLDRNYCGDAPLKKEYSQILKYLHL